MDVTHLRYVAALARLRSFSRAAQALYVSQSSLSQQIAKLEKEIGYPLFQRTTKHVQLTAEGTRFLRQARRVLNEFDNLQELAEATRSSMVHTVNLGMSVVYRPHVSEIVVQFMHEHPEIDLNLVSVWELDLVDMLHSGRVDLALFAVDPDNDDLAGMTTVPLHEERVVAAMNPNHPLAGRESVTLAELAGEVKIFTSELSGVRRLVLQRMRQQGLLPGRCMIINETETRVHYIAQNIGVAFTMDSTHHWQDRGDVVMVPIEPVMKRTYSLVSPVEGAARHPAAINQLRHFLLEQLRGM